MALALGWLALLWGCVVAAAAPASDAERNLLKEVDQMVMEGRSKYKDAVKKLSEIIDKFPDSQKALYKRAEVRDLLKDHHVALQDLHTITTLNPDAKVAYQLRSKIYTRLGRWAEAKEDWTKLAEIYHKSSSKVEKTKKYKEAAEMLQKTHEFAYQDEWLEKILTEEPMNPAHNRACLKLMDKFLEYGKEAQGKYRLKKVDCAMKLKDYDMVNDELTRVLTLQPQNLEALLMKARSLKMIGATAAAIKTLKRCLSLDPENRDCKTLHKQIRKYDKVTETMEEYLSKNLVRWAKVLELVEESFQLDSEPHNWEKLLKYQCRGNVELKQIDKAVELCEKAIKVFGDNNPGAWELFQQLAEALMLRGDLESLETAEKHLQKALELAQGHDEQTVRQSQHRLQVHLKRARTKDYYKILGVPKTATDKEIKKAYRQMAMKHHPDKLDVGKMSKEEEQKASELYNDISRAYEIFKDPELRRRYDNGEDVDDNSNQQQHHDPFGGQGFPFGGGFGGGGGRRRGGGGGFHFRYG